MNPAIQSHSERTEPFAGRGMYEPRIARRMWSLDILLVEDDAADTTLILDVLRRHPNVSGAHASDRPDLVLRQLSAGRMVPDLVFLDIHMPRIDGFTFLEVFRQIPAMIAVPVVFLTTSCLAKDVVEATRCSASSYVIKPDTYAELQSRLDDEIQRAISGDWSR